MTTCKFKCLALGLAFLLNAAAQAGPGKITQRLEDSGSIELTNLDAEEEAQVVVAAPSPGASEFSLRQPQQFVHSPSVEASYAEREKPTDESSKRTDTRADTQNAGSNAASGFPGSFAAGSGANAAYGAYGAGMNAPAGGAPGGNDAAGNTNGGFDYVPNNGGTASSTAANAGSSASSASSGGNTGGTFAGGNPVPSGNTTGAGSAPSAGLSPDQLALRLLQYQEAMLNAPRGTNGLVANPAVQRRYLMTNRAGYMNFGL